MMPLNDRAESVLCRVCVESAILPHSLQTQTFERMQSFWNSRQTVNCTCQAADAATNWTPQQHHWASAGERLQKNYWSSFPTGNLLVRNQVIARFTSFQREREREQSVVHCRPCYRPGGHVCCDTRTIDFTVCRMLVMHRLNAVRLADDFE